MGNTENIGTNDKEAGDTEGVMDLLGEHKAGGDGALYSMAEDLFFFAELIDMQRCIMRMMRLMGDRLPKGLADMAAGLAGLEFPALEKWALFMELL